MAENYPTVEQIILDVMQHCGYRRNYQVAEYFDVTPQTLSGWIKSGVIPPRHLVKYQTEIKQNNKQKRIQLTNGPYTLNPIDKQERKSESQFSIAKTFLLFAKFPFLICISNHKINSTSLSCLKLILLIESCSFIDLETIFTPSRTSS